MTNLINYFFFGSLGLIFFTALVYFSFFYSKKTTFLQYSLNLQLKKIMLIALFAATSTSIVFVLSQFSSITVLPPVRIALEGVMTKISGFLFGPFVGIFCAIATEIAVLIFVPTYFHYKYLIVLICYGFVSGMIKVFFLNSKKNWKSIKFRITVIFTALIVFFSFTQFFFLSALHEGFGTEVFKWNETFKLFKQNYLNSFNFLSLVFFGNLLVFFLLFSFVIFIAFCLWRKIHLRFITRSTLIKVLPVLILTIFTEYFVSVAISTSANQSWMGEHSESGIILLTSALLIAPLKIVINTFIIYQVWNAFEQNIHKGLKK